MKAAIAEYRNFVITVDPAPIPSRIVGDYVVTHKDYDGPGSRYPTFRAHDFDDVRKQILDWEDGQ